MARNPRIFVGDEELGKRDDDHKPGSKRQLALEWPAWPYPRYFTRRNLKRILFGLALMVGMYYFFKNMPTDLGPRTPRPNYSIPRTAGRNRSSSVKPVERTNAPTSNNIQTGRDESNGAGVEEKHWFSGPIRFYKLAESLRAVPSTTGQVEINRNVLFAASNAQSASILLHLACDMAALKRNSVHFAFMGRDDIAMNLLKEVNGVTKECNIMFHDARPDFLLESSDFRMEASCSASLGHINYYVHPQAVIIHNSGKEDEYFLKGLRGQANALGKTVIELPDNAEQNIRWMTRLNSASLRFWNKISIDIVIHAQPAASGSLIRLLDSLSKADYFQSVPPRLTVELPNEVDGPTQTFLQDFQWPPYHYSKESNANQVNLRHRIQQPGLAPEESSIRFLESFWPAKPSTSHVLVLSPQVELSSLFFQYLRYFILEYKYATLIPEENPLLGISLDTPSTYLNDTTPFSRPKAILKGNLDSEVDNSFLWQAPSAAAALYFGDKWTELHSLISHTLVSKHKLPTPTTLNTKEVSETHPSWLEHVLTLARTRGYYMLYPSLNHDTALATIHNELYQPPEEYSSRKSGGGTAAIPAEPSIDWTADPAHHLSLQHKEERLASANLLSTLSSEGNLPSLTDMPLLSWDGKLMTRLQVEEEAKAYRQVFRREIGGCSAASNPVVKIERSADDLFCFATED